MDWNLKFQFTFRSWTPIGYWDLDTEVQYPFSGIFDGAGNKINGLYFKDDSKIRVGLFGLNGGTIKNVNIADSYFCGRNAVGGVCGQNYSGNIETCNNINSFVSGNGTVGGVCGNNYSGTIANCENTGNVFGSDYVGGVCGVNQGLVKNCSNRGNVKASNSGASGGVGGVCGYFSSGSLENSYNTGDVQGSSNVGGICGKVYSSSPSIKNCYYKTKEDNSLAAIGSDGGGYKIYVEGKTSEQFSDGMVAYLLNSRSAEDSPVWYQNIDNELEKDTAPVLDSSHGTVYASKPCPVKCSNTESTVSAESQSHSFGDDNICTVCGAKGEIIDDPTLINDKPSNVDGVYQLETERQFYYFVALVNGRLVGVNQDTSASAVLKTDITVNDNVLDENGNLVSETGNLKTWVPIGYSDGVRVQTYTGTFDGGGHTISGLYFADSSISYVGLFGSSTGTIKNIKVADSYFKGDTYVGGICGKNEGNIEGCEASGKVEANNKYTDFGGICGYNGTGYVKNCKSTVDISHPIHFTYPNGGGIVGQNDGTIENCHNIGELDLIYTNGETAGGICGKNNTSGVIKSCYNTGTVNSKENSGGICGTNSGRISDCYNTGSCRASTISTGQAGGICGSNSGSIANCYSTGNVTGYYTGKICGNKSSGVTNCYYQDSSESDSIAGTTFKEATQFSGGEVAYLLNDGKTDSNVVWRQTLNTDTAPVLDSTHSIVYASKPCESEFANTEFTEEKKHIVTMSEDGTSHTCSVCKKTEQHADVATFTVDDVNHSITATCPGGCELGMIALSATNTTYDSTEKAASISGEIKGFTPTIVYEKKADNGSFETITSTPKDAGTYRASITYTVDADNSKVYTVSTEYTIARKPVTITADNMSMTYGETETALSYKVSDDTPLVDGEVLSGELSREAGEDAGTYKITQGTVTNDTNPNYDITFNEGTFTINKAQTEKTAECEMNLVYDESSESYTATITKVDGAEYRFGESGEWSTENTLTGIAHDTEVTGYIRIAGDENHNPSTTNSLTLKSGHGTLTYVERKEPDCENAGNKEYWYCGSCRQCFSDSDGEREVSKEIVTIPAINHKWNQENYELDATHHWHNCQNENCPITNNSKKNGYEEHIDSNNDGSCEVCQNRIWYIISPTSMLLEKGESVSNISMDPKNGKVVVGEKVTVTTQDMLGYSFKGWYLASDIDAETKQLGDNANSQATSFTYTFKPEDNMSLVAVYEAAGNADVKISGSGFTVSVDDGVASAVQDGTYSDKLSIGSKVTITIVEENSNFINWSNENNKIVSTERTYTFTVTGQTTLTMSKKGTTGSTAMVEFVSAYNQVISGKIYSSTDTIIFPDGPSKMGYTFKNWSLTQDEIQKKIKNGETHITVTPVYEQDTSRTYTVTVYVDRVQDDTQTATGILAGTNKTVTAPDVDGRVFLYWTDEDGNILGYGTSYFMQINKNITVKAVYGEEAVEEKPVIAMTNVFTTSTNGKNKISFTVTRDIPEGYTLVEHGVLYNKLGTIDNPSEDTFVLGGTNVSKYTATTTKLSGVVTLNVNMTGALDTKVVARGYMIVKNSEGKDEIYYSDYAHISYNEKNQEGDN